MKPPAHAQHGAVAAYDQAQVALPADPLHIQRVVLREARVGGGFGLQRQLAVLLGDELGNALDDLPCAVGR